MDAQEARGVGVRFLRGSLLPVPTEPSHLPLDSGLMWFDLKIGIPDVSEPEGLKAFHGLSLSNAGIRLANPGKDEVSRHFFNKCRFSGCHESAIWLNSDNGIGRSAEFHPSLRIRDDVLRRCDETRSLREWA